LAPTDFFKRNSIECADAPAPSSQILIAMIKHLVEISEDGEMALLKPAPADRWSGVHHSDEDP
jgi:hypothetical protein